MNNNMNNNNKLYVPGAKQAIDRMKYEIANEFGVNLDGNTPSRLNGQVGGEITKRLVNAGKSQFAGNMNMNSQSK